MTRAQQFEKELAPASNCATVCAEAVFPADHRKDFEAMAARRFQDPTPEKSGRWWYIRIWTDAFVGGTLIRKLKRIKVAPADTPDRQVKRMAAAIVGPMNAGLVTAGAALPFSKFVETIYIPNELPLLRKPTRDRYLGIIDNHLLPAFAAKTLGEMTYTLLQSVCTNLDPKLSYESRDKIRDVLASIIHAAMKGEFLVKDPTVGLRVAPDKNARRQKPTITPEQFTRLVDSIPEPYASMVFVAGLTGLRVSELIGLRWRNIQPDAISIEQRYTRGDWDVPKSSASAATIGVAPEVIHRIQKLKLLSVAVRAGNGTRHVHVVRDYSEDALVFQSLYAGGPMSDQNILARVVRPAAKRLGIKAVNWQVLRRSHCTWMIQAGADPKSVQALMRHSNVSTTMNVYAQAVPQQQRISLGKLSEFVTNRVTNLSQKSGLADGEDQTESLSIQ